MVSGELHTLEMKRGDGNSDGANFLFLVVKKSWRGNKEDRNRSQKKKEKDEKNSPKDGDNDGGGYVVQQEFQDGFA